MERSRRCPDHASRAGQRPGRLFRDIGAIDGYIAPMWPHLKIYGILSLLTCAIVVGVGAWKFPQVQEGFGLLWKDLIARIA